MTEQINLGGIFSEEEGIVEFHVLLCTDDDRDERVVSDTMQLMAQIMQNRIS
jgi:hypothetical protein